MGGGQGKRENSSPPKGKRESSAPHEGKRKNTGSLFCDPIPLGSQTARTHARTKRNDFPVGLTPNLRLKPVCPKMEMELLFEIIVIYKLTS